jgi:hypothetical protein
MIRKIWNHNHQSVCAVIFRTERGIRAASFTGFKYAKYLITEICEPKTKQQVSEVALVFFEADGKTVSKEILIPYGRFKRSVLKGFDDSGLACSVFAVDNEDFNLIPSLQIDLERKYQIGNPLVTIGYQSEEENMAMKSGTLSSFLAKKGISMFQFEMNISPSFAGAPVFDAENGVFAGFAGARIAKLNESFLRMMELIKGNLEMLSEAEGKVSFYNIDPIQVLRVNQNQIKYLATELFKNNTVAFGYATEAYQLQAVLENIGVLESTNKIKSVKVDIVANPQ